MRMDFFNNRKVYLEPGAKEQVQVFLPSEAFGLYNEDGVFETGTCDAEIYVGGQAPDHRSEQLTGRKVIKRTIRKK